MQKSYGAHSVRVTPQSDSKALTIVDTSSFKNNNVCSTFLFPPSGLCENSQFSKGSGSGYIPTRVMIQTISISKNDTSSIILHGWAILKELLFLIDLAAGHIFFNIWPAQLG